jgi:hypothetical protein
MDATEKTNKECWGLFMVVGQDGNGSIFTGLHCFMPNAQAESFQWIYSHATSELWPGGIAKNVEVVITDSKPALYSPLENEMNAGNIWNREAKVFGCTFHLFIQYWCKYVTGSKNEGSIQDCIVKGIRHWINMLIHQFMYEYQFHNATFCLESVRVL